MLFINESYCKGCDLCIDFCPKKVLKKQHGKAIIANEEACVRCGICEKLCPDFAISLRSDNNE